jgi:hypothetical protein
MYSHANVRKAIAHSVLTEPSAGMDPARNYAVFYHHQEAFRPEISLNEGALNNFSQFG